MDDHDDSGSPVMMILVIAGGAVLVLLALVGAAGFLLFSWREPMPPPVAAAPVAILEEEAPMAVERPRVDEAPPFPNPKQVEAEEQKAIGTWTATFKDGRREEWQIHADRTMKVRIERKGKEAEVSKGTWELLVPLGGAPGRTIWFVGADGKRNQWKLNYLDNDQFVIEPTVVAEVDGVRVKGPEEGVPYVRKKQEKKP